METIEGECSNLAGNASAAGASGAAVFVPREPAEGPATSDTDAIVWAADRALQLHCCFPSRTEFCCASGDVAVSATAGYRCGADSSDCYLLQASLSSDDCESRFGAPSHVGCDNYSSSNTGCMATLLGHASVSLMHAAIATHVTTNVRCPI
jgi:hypothetical protein